MNSSLTQFRRQAQREPTLQASLCTDAGNNGKQWLSRVRMKLLNTTTDVFCCRNGRC